ncbi:hypothetical protein D3C73_1089330 [compost metagenome]
MPGEDNKTAGSSQDLGNHCRDGHCHHRIGCQYFQRAVNQSGVEGRVQHKHRSDEDYRSALSSHDAEGDRNGRQGQRERNAKHPHRQVIGCYGSHSRLRAHEVKNQGNNSADQQTGSSPNGGDQKQGGK